MTGQPRTLDEARRLFPALGFALYAYTPGGAVTLEVHDDGQVFAWTAETEARAWGVAFPIDEPPPEINAEAGSRQPAPDPSDPSSDNLLGPPDDLPEIEADEPAPPSVFD